ncbi:MAG: sugar ABC transporter substrate-binding protein [Clostridiales bacterium]|jgi:simple sugar transport system substrate-binding protein/ribose transport system substrate-binding protein|nr:sugar ABC transporter substrate-binding protein [Clostridiales bacterium]
MRKLFALLLALLMLTGAVALAEEKITVAGVVFQDDQFMNMLSKGYRDAAEALGAEVFTENTNNDQAREVELINTYLTQGVQGIAIAPLSKDASVAALRAADAQGMKVTLTNIDLDSAEFIVGGFSSNDKLNCRLVGATAAEIIKAKFPDKKVKIAIVQFRALLPDQSSARVEGYFEALDEAGLDYEIVADQDAWMQDTALATADGIMIAQPELDVIIAVNDGGTIGSAQAVVNAGKQDRILVFGHDGSEQIASMILDPNNPLQAVVAQDPYGQGFQAMTLLINAIKGEDYSATKGKTTYLDGIVMSKTDLEGVQKWIDDNK